MSSGDSAGKTLATQAVDVNLAAYGQADIAGIAGTLADGVVLTAGDGSYKILGREAVATAYGRAVKVFPLNATVSQNRITLGPVVVDHEVSTRVDGVRRELATLYRINAEGKIEYIEVLDASDKTAATRELIERQLLAYNRQDLDGHCACFAQDVTVSNLGEAPNLTGAEAYRSRYAGLFAQFPQNRATVVNRIVVGAWAVDHERVERIPNAADPAPFDVLALYHVKDGRIGSVRFVREG